MGDIFLEVLVCYCRLIGLQAVKYRQGQEKRSSLKLNKYPLFLTRSRIQPPGMLSLFPCPCSRAKKLCLSCSFLLGDAVWDEKGNGRAPISRLLSNTIRTWV